MQFTLLDTYQDFSDYWVSARSKPVEEQVHMWQTTYMNKFPELLDKQVASYKTDNIDWHVIAGKILPEFHTRLSLIQKARTNILTCYELICAQALEKLGVDFDIILVVYVGIGCGAGWATKYGGRPAILLGLENIAEEKWHTKRRLRGLISHEIGHLAHKEWRSGWGISEEKEPDPLFLLYAEGFAQRCEHLISGKETWHLAPDKEWIHWCEQNINWLAGEFLDRVSSRTPVIDFFGSWFDIRGKKQTGYYLGNAFISGLEKIYTLKEIALLDNGDVRELAIEYLGSIAAN